MSHRGPRSAVISSAGRVLLAIALFAGWGLRAGASELPLFDSLDLLFDDGLGHQMPYRLYLPPNPDPGVDYPLVLFQHGIGERGSDNVAQVSVHIDELILHTQTTEYASFLLAPQLPTTDLWGGAGDLTSQILQDVISSYAVDTDRLYITGLSLGGLGVYGQLAGDPDLFAAALPLSATGNVNDAPLIKDVPLWAFHGELDTTIPLSLGQAMIDALIAAGGDPIFTVVPGAGHDIPWSGVYADDAVYEWMFSQSLPEASSGLGLTPLLLGLVFVRRIRARRAGHRTAPGAS